MYNVCKAFHNIFVTRYHWLCVGIKSEPGENQDWFCTRCVAKKQVNIEEVLMLMLMECNEMLSGNLPG